MKNKYLYIILALLLLSTLKGQSVQNLNGYKYVGVDILQYQSGRTDIWGISAKLINMFNAKGFQIIIGTDNLPQELIANPCLLIRCFIEHSSVISGTNEVRITLKNCLDQVVYTKTGGAMGLSLQDDYNKATKRSFSEIETLNYKYSPFLTPEIQYPSVEKVNETETSFRSYLDSVKTEQIEGIFQSYADNNIEYYKIGIKKQNKKYIAFIIDCGNKIWKPKEIKMYIESTAMNNVFSIKYLLRTQVTQLEFLSLKNEVL